MNPLFTEKSTSLYNNFKICTFEVKKDKSKYNVAYDFIKLYNIKPLDIKILNRLGKYKRHKKNFRKLSLVGSKKIAYIKIGKNEKLDIFEVK